MKIYALRSKHTGLFMSWPRGSRRNRGGSLGEFDTIDSPRLFRSPRAAVTFATHWKRGIYQTEYYKGEPNTKLIPVASRILTKVELVEFSLTDPKVVSDA